MSAAAISANAIAMRSRHGLDLALGTGRTSMRGTSATLAATALCVFLVRPAARAPAPQQHGVFQPSIAELQPSAAVSPKPKQRARRIVSAPVQRHANIAEDQRSFPAPPQPLTEQERVLQRVVEQNQPETMKALKLIASNDGPEHVSIQPGEPR